MFAPCPHCGYLIALIATRDASTLECPRCHHLLEPGGITPPVRSVPPPTDAPPRYQAIDVSPTHAAHSREDALPSSTPSPSNARNIASAHIDPAPLPVEASSAATTTPNASAIISDASNDAAASTTSDVAAPGDASNPPASNAPDAITASPISEAPALDATPSSVIPNTLTADPPRKPRPRGASPSFARTASVAAAPVAGRARRWPARMVAIALALLLGLQLLLAQRDSLARSAQWRPVIASLCGVGLCTLPPWRDPAAFTMLSRNVAPVPGTRELDVVARFRNDAPWPQAWPHLHLVLSDAQGRLAAARVLAPRDYAGTAAQTPIAPQQSVDARVRVREPEPATVAFAFDFR